MGYLRGVTGNWEMGSGVYFRHIMIKKFWGYRHDVKMRGDGGKDWNRLCGGLVIFEYIIWGELLDIIG